MCVYVCTCVVYIKRPVSFCSSREKEIMLREINRARRFPVFLSVKKFTHQFPIYGQIRTEKKKKREREGKKKKKLF